LEKEKPPIFGLIQRTGEVVIRMLANVQPGRQGWMPPWLGEGKDR
jgi:hypothetical protein